MTWEELMSLFSLQTGKVQHPSCTGRLGKTLSYSAFLSYSPFNGLDKTHTFQAGQLSLLSLQSQIMSPVKPFVDGPRRTFDCVWGLSTPASLKYITSVIMVTSVITAHSCDPSCRERSRGTVTSVRPVWSTQWGLHLSEIHSRTRFKNTKQDTVNHHTVECRYLASSF